MKPGLFRSLLCCTSLCSLSLVSAEALANPQGGTVSAGQASISQQGSTLTITQSSSKAVIDWRSFDIAPSETTQFQQPSSSSITLNRVNDVKPSDIEGKLTANGNVIIINPNGVFFGKTAQVDVAGLTATTSGIDNDQFMNNAKPVFNKPGNPNAQIVNQGSITARQAGLVGLVAPQVINNGVITAKLGKVAMASGDTFTLDLAGDGILSVQVSADMASQLVQNTGTVSADGGTVTLTAAAARSVISSLVENTGTLQARSIGSKTGSVTLYAEGSNAVQGNVTANKGQKTGTSVVRNSGTIDVSGRNAGEKGGTVQLLADQVEVKAGSHIDASGDTGGGYIKIGGDFHGQGTTPTALETLVEQNTLIEANSITSGDGGNIAIWSDQRTTFDGRVEVRTEGDSGDGGFAETSGHSELVLTYGQVAADSRRGRNGEWLLDPADVTITTADANITGNPNFVPDGTVVTSTINAATIVTALNAGTNVTVTTGGDAQSGPNGGSITVSSAISATTGTNGVTGNLTLSSYKDIIINAAITLGGSGVQGGNLLLQADNHGNGAGDITVAAAISTNGGNITMGGGSGAITAGSGYAVGSGGTQIIGIYVNNVAVNAGGGNIIMNGEGWGGANTASSGVRIGNGTSGSVTTSGSGTIQIYGIGRGGGAGGNYGVEVDGGSSIVSVDGNITVSGTGGGASSGGSNYGVYIASTSNTAIKTTGRGNISVTGQGGYDNVSGVNGGSDYGIYVTVANGINATGTGGITLNGTGGTGVNSTPSATNGNIGVYVTGSVTGAGGAMSITGQGGNSSQDYNSGIYVNGGTISNAALGTLTLSGTGGGNTNSGSNYGLYVDNTGTISTIDGNLTVNNTTGGGAGSGANNYGVNIGNVSANTITTSGVGSISITAAGGNTDTTGGSDYGIYVNRSNGVNATGIGTITLNGTGGGANNVGSNYGICVPGSITGGGGTISITGTGGNSSGNSNFGIYNAAGTISNKDRGTLTLSGAGGGITNSGSNYGIYNNGTISTVNGNLTINNTTGGGAGSGANNYGFYNIGGPLKTSGSGNISITASGGNASGSGSTNYGIYITNVATGIQTTGIGTITLNGTGGNGSGSGTDNYGVYLANSISSQWGVVSITGTGGNSSSTADYGIRVDANIVNSGNGAVTLTGTGKNGAVDIFNNTVAATIGGSSANGNITINADTATWGSLALQTTGNV
ncbi:MAG: filamentous hemagglutinin N-terminal domain-containing protein, partial [Pseudomonadota bacterium]|nr:filamentous hemagglutinin N-terminal domain-containing protein [Pseudomonadota bacterium]